MVPGETRPGYENGPQARQVLNDAEDDLRDWRPEEEELGTPARRESPEEARGRGDVEGEEVEPPSRSGNGDGNGNGNGSGEGNLNRESYGPGDAHEHHDDRSSQADA